jgi:hypothetical protein
VGLSRVNPRGNEASARTATIKTRSRDCGMNSAAPITKAPKTYPASAIARATATKSAPLLDVISAATFSMTMRRGARPSETILRIKAHQGKKAPLRAPSSPAPFPASEMS